MNHSKYIILYGNSALRILFLLFLFIVPLTAYSQNFDVTVTVITDALPIDAKDRLKDFKLQVEDYFNKNKFYDDYYFNENRFPGGENYKIKGNLQFNFTGTNGLDVYDAQVLVVSQRIIDRFDKQVNPKYTILFKYLDEKCSFYYNRTMPFIKNEMRFDPFLSLLDYYAFMMLGYDQESFYPKDHPKNRNFYFQKAIDICNKPMTDRKGWSDPTTGSKPSRLQLVQELLNTRFDNFRFGFFEYHWMGLDSMGFTRNAYQYILNALEKISNIKKSEVRTYNIDIFFDTKAQEIAELFLDYGDKSVYYKLIQYDMAHQRIYEEAMKRAR